MKVALAMEEDHSATQKGGGGGADRHVIHGDSHVSLLLVDISPKIHVCILVYIIGILSIVAPYMFSS